MKTAYNHLTHSYETPDKTTVAAEVCEGDTPSDAFRAAAIREQQRKLLTDEEIGELYRKHNDTPGFNFEGFARRFARAIEAAIREALAQPEQEPVGETYLCDACFTPFNLEYECPKCGHGSSTQHPVYTTPPQRTWVGLTHSDIDQGLLRSDYAFKTAEAWRAGVVFAMTKLKEKNT